jgi:hypothetical protein
MDAKQSTFTLPLSTAETSVVISLLDLLNGDGTRLADTLSEIEKRFFNKCRNFINESLNKIGFQLHPLPHLIAVTKQDAPGDPNSILFLTPDELSALMNSLEKNILHTEAYNYVAMVDAIMRGAVAYFMETEPELAESFKQVVWEPNVVSGEEFLCHFETGFGTGGLQVS